MPPEARGAEWFGMEWLAGPAAVEGWRAGPMRVPFVHPRWLATWSATHDVDATQVRIWARRTDTGPYAYAAWLLQSRRWPGGVELRRLQPLGQAQWLVDAFPGEYAALGGPFDATSAQRALEAALALGWDELLLERVPAGGALASALHAWSTAHGFPAEFVARPPAWRIATEGAAERHRASLSQGERRALYGSGSRSRVEYVAEGGELAVLYRLHDARWAGAGMPARVRRFLDALADAPVPEFRLRVSRLLHGGRACSARLLLDCAGTTYDLQSGFDAGALPGASPGKLHLGFELERAFLDPATQYFDLLAGHGRRADYKARLGAEAVPLYDVRVVRSAWVRALRRARRWAHDARARVSPRAAANAGGPSVRSRRSPAPPAPRGGAAR